MSMVEAAPTPRCILLCVLLAPLALGCRRDMFDQPKQKTLSRSDFFEDGAAARPPPEGAVPHAMTGVDHGYPVSNKAPAKGAAEGPPPRTMETLQRGRERFEIFCSPCHGLGGAGDGMIVQRGYKRPPSFHIDRLRAAPPGYFVGVITNGFGVMPSYAVQVPPSDRWAIAAYIDALQLSQSARIEDLPPEDSARIEAIQ